MASGDKRIGTSGDSMPFGTEVICVGPLLLNEDLEFPCYVPLNMGYVRVKKVRAVTTVAVAGGDVVVTVKNGTTTEDMTGGELTIALSDTAPGVEDDCDIVNDENARVDALDEIILSIEGTTPSAGEAIFFIEYERCQ